LYFIGAWLLPQLSVEVLLRKLA